MIRLNQMPLCKRFVQLIIHTFSLLCLTALSPASPTITSIEPTIGEVGQDLNVTIHGTGFNENTKVLVYPDSGNRMRILGSEGSLHEMWNVAVACNTAYITAEEYLQIIDVSNSTNPMLKSTTGLPSFGKAIAVQNNMAYILTEQHGMLIYNVADPSQPIKIGTLLLPSASFILHSDILLAGSFAYVAHGSSGLYIIDVSDPSHPSIAGHAATSGPATGVSLSGQWAFVADYDYGLLIFDVSNPAAPSQKGSIQMPGDFPIVMDVAVVNQTAFVLGLGDEGGLFDGLQIIDVSDPQHPVFIGSIITPGMNHKISIKDNIAYIATPDFGLHVIDVSSPGAPVFLGSISSSGYASDVAIANGLAYVAADTLEILDVGNISRSSIISSVQTSLWAEGITVNNTTAYVADLVGLELYDISNPNQPRFMSTVECDILEFPCGGPRDVVVQDNIAYVADGYGLQLININDGEHPAIIEWVQIGDSSNPWDVEVVNKIAYVAAYEYGLQIIDVDPDSPTYLDIIGTLNNYSAEPAARGVSVNASTAYVADENVGLCIIDISNLKTPKLITSIEPSNGDWTMGLAVAGNFAYLALENDGLQVVDISDPAHPSLLGSLATLNITGYDVSLVGNTAYLASLWQGVHAIDVSDQYNPNLLATIPSIGYAYDLNVVDNVVHVADSYAGFSSFAAPQVVIPVLDPVVPGNVMTATLPADFKGSYSIRVQNEAGSDELTGAVTLLDELPKSKAVIVAGYGPHVSNKLWDETLLNANYAWNVLSEQGYQQENIRYLSPIVVDVNDDGTPDVNGDATLSELETTLTTWASDADDLILYLVGHGGKENFVMKHNDSVHEELGAKVLAGWLNNLQASIKKRTIIIYEACYSGSFLDALQIGNNVNFERTLITSSTSSQVAILGNKGLTSFSHRFWESVYERGELVESFVEASELMTGFGQTSWLDGNCDGLPNTPADSSQEKTVGRGHQFQLPLKPVVSCSASDQNLGTTNSAVLWAKTVSSDPITRVWAEIIPPNYNPLAPNVPELPTFDLIWSASKRRYEGLFSQFYEQGTYHVALYAMDNQQIVSLPSIVRVTVPSFSWNLFMPAIIGKKNVKSNN